LFDSAAYALYARDRRYLTPYGSYHLDELTEFPCPCEVCRRHSVSEVKHSAEVERLLALHNLYVTLAEISRIRQAIREGTLWEVVDERCRNHPRLLEGYRAFLDQAAVLEPRDRVSKKRFFYRGTESCRRTEVIRYQERLASLNLQKEVIISLRGGVSTPLQLFLFKPPFGPFPLDLSETFPIGQSVIPGWDLDMVKQGCAGIRSLVQSHPDTKFTIISGEEWFDLIVREIPHAEVLRDLS
ncbi:MAG: tRNA-guanine transglycosylase, partial [Methanomicrobiales archaeon]|nr:tRNA-guanine transglycosylase [Methanomicrobiales archaeon]